MSEYKEQVRTIKIDGLRYGWRNTHRHDSITTGRQICVDHFLAFREGTSEAALRIRFTGAIVGGWGGHIGLIKVPALGLFINLHQPRIASALIRRALELGWSSEAPMAVDDGDTFIANLPKPVLTGTK